MLKIKFQLKYLNCLLDDSPHYCISATLRHCILDKALLSILLLFSLIYCAIEGTTGDVSEKKGKGKRKGGGKKRQRERWGEMGREVAVIEKQRS